MLVEDIGSNLERIDIYLSKKLDETRSRIQELIKSNNILVNGKKLKLHIRLILVMRFLLIYLF